MRTIMNTVFISVLTVISVLSAFEYKNIRTLREEVNQLKAERAAGYAVIVPVNIGEYKKRRFMEYATAIKNIEDPAEVKKLGEELAAKMQTEVTTWIASYPNGTLFIDSGVVLNREGGKRIE